jgi:hypothetical protein
VILTLLPYYVAKWNKVDQIPVYRVLLMTFALKLFIPGPHMVAPDEGLQPNVSKAASCYFTVQHQQVPSKVIVSAHLECIKLECIN